MTAPKLSVLMTAYNSELFIKKAIDSILSQTFKDFEFIIIDDGSVDGTLKIISSYRDPRIIVISRENKGRHASLEEGVKSARGEYIAIMDSDDISMPTRLAKEVEYLDDHPECAVVTTLIKVIDANGKNLEDWPADQANITPRQIRKTLPKENCVANPAAMIRGSLIKKLGYQQNQVAEDYDLWLRMISAGYEIHKLAEPLIKYRIIPSSITQQSIGSSLNRKNLNFKKTYLRNQVRQRKIGTIELRVAWSLVGLILTMSKSKLLSDIRMYRTALSGRQHNSKSGKNILFVLPWMEMGGADRVALSVMKGIKDRKSKSKIFCATTVPSPNEWRPEFAELCEDVADFSDLEVHAGIAEKVAQYAAENSIDVVVISNSVSGYVAAELIKHQSPRTRIIDIVHGQGGQEEKGGIPLHSAPYDKFLDKRVSVTHYMKKYLVKEYGISPHKIEVIHNGIDLDDSSPLPPPAPEVQRSSGKYLVVWSGRFNVEKHPELVIDIAEKLYKKTPAVHFILAGDGPLRQKLRRLIEQKALQDLITITPGAYDDYRQYIAYCDLLLMTSEMEGLPIVILEAFSESKPVIAPRVGGIPEIVKDHESGYTIKFDRHFTGNAAKKIFELYSDIEKSKRLGKRGQRDVKNAFLTKKMQHNYCRLIFG